MTTSSQYSGAAKVVGPDRPIRTDVRLFVLKPFALSRAHRRIGLLGPVAAEAQFSRGDPATGELYTLEVAYGWWNPEPLITISSEGLGLPGTEVDFETDLGIDSKRLQRVQGGASASPEAQVQARLPADHLTGSRVTCSRGRIVFNGQVYAAEHARSTSRPTGPPGASATSTTSSIAIAGMSACCSKRSTPKAKRRVRQPDHDRVRERRRRRFPRSASVGRGYLLRNVSVTGEFSVFSIPGDEAGTIRPTTTTSTSTGRSASTGTRASWAGGGASTWLRRGLGYRRPRLDGLLRPGVVRF